MKAVAVAALFLIAGCGRVAAPVSNVATPARVTATPAPVVSTPAPPAAAYGVVVDLTTGPGYTVTLVASDGHIAATAHAALRSITPDPGIAGLPYISITSSRVYFLDGDSVVRWIDPTGASGAGPQLPGTKTTPVAFAVSPDNSRIAVTRYDLTANPVFLQLYTDSIGGGSQKYIFKSQSDYIWPVGWHAGSIILAAQTFPPYTQIGALQWNPYGAMAYHVVDPDNADRLFTLGSGEDLTNGCQPTGPLTAAGTGCSQYPLAPNDPLWAGLGIVDWTGKFHFVRGPLHEPSKVWVSSVSSDVNSGQLAFCCETFQNFNLVGSSGYVATKLPGQSTLDWVCWLDGTRLMTATATFALGDKSSTPLATRGFCAGVLPAALG